MFGPRKLPEIARMIGKTLDQLRHASQDFKDEIMKIEDDVKKEVKDVVADVVDHGDSHEVATSTYDNPYTESSYYHPEHPEIAGNSAESPATDSEHGPVAGQDAVEVVEKGAENVEEKKPAG